MKMVSEGRRKYLASLSSAQRAENIRTTQAGSQGSVTRLTRSGSAIPLTTRKSITLLKSASQPTSKVLQTAPPKLSRLRRLSKSVGQLYTATDKYVFQGSLPAGSPSPYQRIDMFLGGRLPFGVSRNVALSSKLKSFTANSAIKRELDIAKAQDKVSSAQLKAEREAELALIESQSDEQVDLLRRSWYEKIGLFRSEQEETFQDLLRQKTFFESINPLIDATVPAGQEYLGRLPELQEVLSAPTPETPKENGGGIFGGTKSFLSGVGITSIIAVGAVAYIFLKKK